MASLTYIDKNGCEFFSRTGKPVCHERLKLIADTFINAAKIELAHKVCPLLQYIEKNGVNDCEKV